MTSALRRLCRARRISVTVFSPSAKSCAITANATAQPTVLLTWKARPMPTPSRNECPTRAAAPSEPPGRGGGRRTRAARPVHAGGALDDVQQQEAEPRTRP